MAKGNRSGKGYFAPGKSGNPGGRPKENKDFQNACREKSEEALQVIYELMKTARADIRLDCAKYIIDRAWGKVAEAKESPSVDDAVKQLVLAARNAPTEPSNT